MFPPADDPPDLGIPPNRGPLPVRRNPNSKPNPRGFGVRAHRGALRGILDVFFYFTALFRICFSHFTEKISRHFKKSPTIVSFPNSSCDKRCFQRLTTLCPSGQTLAFVQAINAMPGRRDSGARAHRGALCEILDSRSGRFLTELSLGHR
ncbi:hypothetical protein AAG906_025839 [Vitis piasezkii]